ncbi:RHS repeat-associated core domain-containing protein [Micromonospora eburnea]|uniref:RHS repeat-associated core domain-containing protein n=2 Tax=Micromonospora eburnea TaxID=227316 RepID=A0A1C6TW79_9ACTN|nr:RHS repeat-associated core domain-containing protein [Micromonospora eburnea]
MKTSALSRYSLSVAFPSRRGKDWGRGPLAAAVAAVLVAGLLQAGPARATPAGYQRSSPKPAPMVPVRTVQPAGVPAAKQLPLASAKPAPVWPEAGAAVVDLTAGRLGADPVRAGTLPIRVNRSAATARTGGAAASRVRVEVFDRVATTRAGVRGLLMRVGRTDGVAAPGQADVSVDYGSFATAYGADWASRLRLVSLPECALTTPERKECLRTPLKSHNDLGSRTVTASVAVGGAQTLLALEAADSGPAGDYKATPLQPSATWSAGGSAGAFTWSYPMRVPPGAGGPEPQVELSYSSQSVDGRHAASNNQPSWIGEGFEGWPGGYIERTYRNCSDDMGGSANNTEKATDLCWETDNATLSLAGHAGELIYNSTEGRWHLRNDDGSRIERRTGASNGDNNGEYWVLTTTAGVQYWFGLNRLPGWASGNPETNSTWTVPVFGNEPGEPCHATTFAASHCTQAWRWNLDYVLDLNANSVSYWYGKETNKYARNLDQKNATTYDRGGWLDRIDYGTRQTSGVDSVFATPAPFRVELTEADRCLSGCATHDEAHWPDTPWDSECTGTSCTDTFAPTFWTTKRLASVTTQVRSGSAYSDVERWTFTHSFPDPGDGTRAGLWLSKISHVGLVGGSASLPDIEFTPVQLSNRVDTIDFAAAMNWMRIAKIRNEAGGTTSVNYSAQDCKAGQTMPTPQTNTRRCYPVIWEPEGYSNPVTDWFHKYVVTTIYENDNTGGVPPQGSPRVVYSYSYYDGAAWHYNDDDGIIDPKRKTWSDYRGYGRVGVTVGDPGEQAYTETRYFRGMNGDRATPTGGTRPVTIDGIADEDWYAGMTRESTVYNGPNGPVVSRERNVPWASAATATRTINGDTVTARFIGVGTTTRHTALDAGRGERVTKTVTTYDSYGMAVVVDDLGQDGVEGDERCTKTDYAPRNTTAWIMDRAHRVQSYAVKCADTAAPTSLTENDVIGEVRTSYDGNAFGVAPTRGMATRNEEMSAWNAGAPTFTTVSRSAYDSQGRVTSVWDANNYETKTAYTPATGGPVTAVTVTNAAQHVTTTTVSPGYGIETSVVDPNGKRTDLAYDGLGRLKSVWLPGRDKATQSANSTFSYTVRNDAATVVAASKLTPSETYSTSYALYDGLMRERQTQAPSISGGRLLTETFYDTAGRKSKSFGSYHASGTAGGTLVTTTERAFVPNQTRTVYDGAGRAMAEVFQPYDAERWRTSTYYAGDRTDFTPAAGGTATSSVADARGQLVELRYYHGAIPTPATAGSWDATKYTFNRKGQKTAVTDARGNKWTYTFDIRGRQTEVVDPDKGKAISTYDNGGRVATLADARGKKLAYQYDSLNRKRAVYENQVGGTMRAQWMYDTVAKGQLTQSTRFVGAASYQVKITGYSDAYQPTGQQIIIPTSETGLAGTYNFGTTYNADNSVASQSMPSTNGDLPAETLLFDYNTFGLPSGLRTLYGSANLSYVADTDYNALGQVDQVELYTGSGGRVFQSFTRELETGRLTGIRTDRDSAAPNILADVRYSYDNTGNITKITDVTPDPVDDTQCFAYDQMRRLTEAWTPSSGDCTATRSAGALGGPAPYWRSWTFDSVGNRRTEVVHTSVGDTTTTYNYPPDGSPKAHSLTSTTGGQVGSYTYDETGNTLTRPTGSAGTQNLTWDFEGHLDTASDSTGQTSFVYDADGNRLIRRDPTGKTLYLPGQEIRYNSSTQNTTCTRYYSHAGSTIASRTAAGLDWLTGDHHGTAGVTVNAATQQAAIRRETPYGTPRGAQPAWPNDKGFVGGTKDNTGLTHLGAREYDPAIGRFISVDPVLDLADPQQMNGYNYSNNSPVTASDPTGLKQCGDDRCTMYTTPTPDGEIVHEPGGKKTKIKKPKVCSERYCIGSPRNPTNHGPWDDQFVYDPNAKWTPEDVASWSKWQGYRYGCIASEKANMGRCAGWADAPYMYDHYLNGTGDPYVFTFSPAYYEDAMLRRHIDLEIAAAQRAAEDLMGKSGSNSFQMTGGNRHFPGQPSTEKWQKIVGSFDMWASAEVTVTGDTVAMRITIHAEDRWNFNRGAHDLGSGIKDDENGRFAVLGKAKGFNSSGSMVKEVTWTIGSPRSATVSDPKAIIDEPHRW